MRNIFRCLEQDISQQVNKYNLLLYHNITVLSDCCYYSTFWMSRASFHIWNVRCKLHINVSCQELTKKRKKNLWYYMAGKVENKKLEEYENENYYLLRWSDKRHFPYNWLGLSDEDNSVSRYGPITLWMWMFSTVLHLLVYSLTVAFCTIS